MEWLIVGAFLIGFCIIWLLISGMISKIGGWGCLVEDFQAADSPEGKGIALKICYVGKARYKTCLQMYPRKRGLYLAVSPIFRFGHPMLMIPWQYLIDIRQEKKMFQSFVVSSIGKPEITTISLIESDFQNLIEYLSPQSEMPVA